MNKGKTALFALAGAFLALHLTANDFHVTSTGSSSGNGSKEKPWDLATALGHPSSVKPGDTIWVHSGTYVGHFKSALIGSPTKPIIVRAPFAERATLDGNYGGNETTLEIDGSNAWFWGLEVTNSDPTRTSPDGNNPARRGEGVNLFGTSNKLINMVIHDTAQGVLSPSGELNSDVYGSVIYYNGYDASDRGHGHAIYVQNDGGGKKIVDNILFSQYGFGIHAYTEGAKLNDLDFEGNTSFNNGNLSKVSGLTTNILIGASGSAATDANASGKVAKNTVVANNYAYSSASGGVAANLGYSKGIASPKITGNYLVGTTALALVNAFRPLVMNGNTYSGTISGFDSTEFPNNSYLSARPTGLKVFVRANQYEQGRANITVYNWDRAATVDVDLKGALPPGSYFELRNAQNFYGPAVLEGKYDGSPLKVPMSNLAAAVPVGRAAPPATGPEFQVFVLLPKAPPPAARLRPHPTSSDPGSPRTVARLERTGQSSAWSASASAMAPSGDLRSLERQTRYFPEVASLSDGQGMRRSAVSVSNGGPDPVTVRLRFFEHDRDNTAAPTVAYVLAPGQVLEADDALAMIFGASETFGAMEVEMEGSARVSVVDETRAPVSVSTTIRRPLSAVAETELAPAGTLVDLPTENAFRSEIGLLNPAAGGAEVSLTLLLSPATALATTFVFVPPRGYVRRSLASLFPSAVFPPGASVSIAVDAGALPVFALAWTPGDGERDRVSPIPDR